MKSLIKSFVVIIIMSGLFTSISHTHAQETLSDAHKKLAQRYSNKIVILVKQKNINLEVFINKLDSKIENRKLSAIVKLLLMEVSKNLKIKICNNYYPIHKDIVASVFWIGEEESHENAYITNDVSAWDENWVNHMLEGKENSFYFALPYNDFDNYGKRRTNAKNIPWYGLKNWGNKESIVKNRWIKVTYNGKTIYAQWEDVGPLEENDVDYVFGDTEPKNDFKLKAGLDLSPDAADYLGIGLSKKVDWSFVPAYCVADGSWTKTITKSGITWY